VTISNAEEQVWVEDIVEQEEMALDCWKVTYNFWQRLEHQGAPEYLRQSMAEISTSFNAAFKKLEEVRAFFPPQEEP
jgi:hypothetical protein